MPKLATCRLLLESEPHAGAWNMAVDEALLETAVETGIATLRWYRWAEPTLSLGYFQNVKDIDQDERWSQVPRVRRLTGGGAILHHQEWTYSLCVPRSLAIARVPEELYDFVHLAFVEVLNLCGWAAELRGVTRTLRNEPVLCFSRCDAHDVVINGQKILGSAQRRRKGAILQHGSLIMAQSPVAPEYPGILDFPGGIHWDAAELQAVSRRLISQPETGCLTEQELARVTILEETNRAARSSG